MVSGQEMLKIVWKGVVRSGVVRVSPNFRSFGCGLTDPTIPAHSVNQHLRLLVGSVLHYALISTLKAQKR